MDDGKLVGKENQAGGVGVVQADLGFINKHALIVLQPLTNTRKIVICHPDGCNEKREYWNKCAFSFFY